MGASGSSRTPAFIWGALAALTCPCHLPLFLAMFAASSLAAVVGEHWVIAVVVLTGLFLLSLSGAIRAFRDKS